MYCSNCGKADQKENAYCRNCGEFLPDSSKNSRLVFGVNTPQQTANIISGVSLIASVLSLLVVLWLYATGFNIPMVIYLAAATLICNTIWHAANFFLVQKWAKQFKSKSEKSDSQKEVTGDKFSQRKTLPTADLSDVVPISVTENTTGRLVEKQNSA